MVFADFSSAFNTVQPHLMGHKLLQMDVNPHLILWVLSFLTNRHQVVRINGHFSSTKIISTGAPHGSVISPVLFTLYTDNCRSSDLDIIYIKYLDDTVILDTTNLEGRLQTEMDRFSEWCRGNYLDLNASKTKELVIDYRREHSTISALEVNDQIIEQQCTIERRGFRQELDSWRHKLIHCVGFESILEGLFGPGLVKDLTLFQDCEPESVSDWSFDENCLFCCLRREKVKEHLVGLNNQVLLAGEDGCKQEQSKINRLEKQAEEFLNAVFYRKADIPGFSDPHIPLVAREIMQRMIRHKLLMADQDSPLDLTVKKADIEPSDQDGVLDLSTKKNHNVGGVSLKNSHGYSVVPRVKGRPVRADHVFRDGDGEDGLPPEKLTGRDEGEFRQLHPSQAPASSLAADQGRAAGPETAPAPSWSKSHFDSLLKLKASSTLNDLKDLPIYLENAGVFSKGPGLAKSQEAKKDHGHSPPVDLKIPQNRRSGLGGILDSSADFWGVGRGAVHLRAAVPYPPTRRGIPARNSQGRRGDGTRQYNSEILEEAISVVMNGKMSVSKAQNMYGIPHSTLEYKVKERLGTLKKPSKEEAEAHEDGRAGDGGRVGPPRPGRRDPRGGSDSKDE
ncbi:hypothetical protein SKAU_G00141420 [Synaphobranchus kaupii]|uniref:HTH psq-type domain-containing protein n=1 Tax=Synaphobranchus kaupii TaxID=118154 RepID=A0A9Q1FSX9_SYNKA|nr:hypothetical protein SKAU_G00141420 [Synaphobranchus kaupii]